MQSRKEDKSRGSAG